MKLSEMRDLLPLILFITTAAAFESDKGKKISGTTAGMIGGIAGAVVLACVVACLLSFIHVH